MTILLVSLIIVFGPEEGSLIHINVPRMFAFAFGRHGWPCVSPRALPAGGAGVSLEQLVMLSINTGIMLLVFGLGLQADS
jgi:hypothetical protein